MPSKCCHITMSFTKSWSWSFLHQGKHACCTSKITITFKNRCYGIDPTITSICNCEFCVKRGTAMHEKHDNCLGIKFCCLQIRKQLLPLAISHVAFCFFLFGKSVLMKGTFILLFYISLAVCSERYIYFHLSVCHLFFERA